MANKNNQLFPGGIMALSDKIYQGIQIILNTDYQESAKWVLTKFLEEFSDHAQAYYDLGVLYFNKGDNDKAFNHYEKAALLDPNHAGFQKNLADIFYVEKNNPEQALVLYKKALAINGDDIQALLTSGHICTSLQYFEEAKNFYNRVLDIEPWHIEAQEYLDKICAYEKKTHGNMDGTSYEPETSLKTSPKTSAKISPKTSSEDMYAQAKKLIDNEKDLEAIGVFQQLIGINPNNSLAHNNLGVLYLKLQHNDKAKIHYEKAVSLSPENMTFQKNLADFYFVKTGNIKKALEIYLDVLTAHPEDLESLMNIGLVCLSLNRVVDAEVFFKRVLELEPWNAQASEQLYKIHSSKTHECTKNNEEDLYKKACRHIDSGNTEQAINQLKELLNIYPDSAIAHNDLGVLYYRKGDKIRSQYHYEQALELMPENTTFKKNLADFYYIELGKIKEALRIYVDILNDNPKDVETLMITGHICLSLEQFDDAKVFYDRVLNIDPFHSDAKKNIKQLEDVCVANNGYDKKKNLI